VRPYDQLTEAERKAIDDGYRQLHIALSSHLVFIAGDDRAERVVDAIATGVIASRAGHSFPVWDEK
jgi:hypothetical protein